MPLPIDQHGLQSADFCCGYVILVIVTDHQDLVGRAPGDLHQVSIEVRTRFVPPDAG